MYIQISMYAYIYLYICTYASTYMCIFTHLWVRHGSYFLFFGLFKQTEISSNIFLPHSSEVTKILQETSIFCKKLPHCITLQHAATQGNALRHTAAHCNTLHHTGSQQHIVVAHFWSDDSFFVQRTHSRVTRCRRIRSFLTNLSNDKWLIF